MCGIVGYIGNKKGRSIVFEGLQRLEYRGYDSAGFACIDDQSRELCWTKSVGQLVNLERKLTANPVDGYLAIGHTRWATHGVISESNAHPQFNCLSDSAVVHNGIIENHFTLRQKLSEQGHVFASSTDTEVIAHLTESFSPATLKNDVLRLVSQLKGAYACLLISSHWHNIAVAIRKGSPLCIGVGDQEYIVASDPYAFARYTKQVIYMPDESFALVSQGQVNLYDFFGNQLSKPVVSVEINVADSDKNGFEHYMLKEIYQQKTSIHETLSACRALEQQTWQGQMALDVQAVRALKSLCLIGAGTSWHAGRIAQFFFEKICMIPTRVLLASEFRYAPFFPEEKGLYIAISQSGETADTLECLRLINTMHLSTLALTNGAASSIVREANGFLLTKAGQEIAVASTKAFSTQLVALFWLAHWIALQKGLINHMHMDKACEDVLIAAEALENTIATYKRSIEEKYAAYYAQFKRFIFLGRHISYPFALEAALKLKEVSYIFSQCYPAGELKHGPIALLDQETPVVLFSNLEPTIYQKVLSNAQEVKARNAHLIAFVFEGQDELYNLADCAFIIPNVNPLLAPLAMTGLMQFLVYQIAKVLECPIDKPRNLAKSVTVE